MWLLLTMEVQIGQLKLLKELGLKLSYIKQTGDKGAALKTGFTTASNLGADIIVTMDSDGQHNPANIPKLVAPIIKGEAEMVNG